MSGADWHGRRLHFVGIGGAGMSGLAVVAAALGAEVSGSDVAESTYLAAVRAAGIEVRIGHDAGNVPPGDDVVLVVSSAIDAGNVERAAGRERGLATLHRGALLGELSRLRRTIAIAGAHGKTTTAAMVVHALTRLGWDPSYVIGGELRASGRNAALGSGEWLVVEADESDRSFLALSSEIAVATNIELDHHTTYATLAELEQAYAEFLRNGLRRIVADGPAAEAYLDRVGIVEAAFYDATAIELDGGGSRFSWAEQTVRVAAAGAHNARNAAAALTACVIAGAHPRELARTLDDFAGTGGRFETLGETAAGARVIDDYAHHPTEVRAAIAAARALGRRRVVAAFQPHLFSRTRMLAREFGQALAEADVAIVLDVYPSRERAADFPGVSGLLIVGPAVDAAAGRPVGWAPDFAAAERLLAGLLRAGDVCLTLGAGDVDVLGRRLVGG